MLPAATRRSAGPSGRASGPAAVPGPPAQLGPATHTRAPYAPETSAGRGGQDGGRAAARSRLPPGQARRPSPLPASEVAPRSLPPSASRAPHRQRQDREREQADTCACEAGTRRETSPGRPHPTLAAAAAQPARAPPPPEPPASRGPAPGDAESASPRRRRGLPSVADASAAAMFVEGTRLLLLSQQEEQANSWPPRPGEAEVELSGPGITPCRAQATRSGRLTPRPKP